VIVANMPGAGSAVAAASLFAAPPQDGTRLGIVAGGAVIDPLLGGSQARYDARKFHWIGGRSTEPSVCALWHGSPVKTMHDAMARESAIGASGPGSRTVTYPKLLNELIGTKFKVVTGYPGGNEISLAMERGEVDGHCGLSWGSVKSRLASWLRDGKLNFLTQFALTRAPDLPKVPLAGEFAKNERDRKAIEFLESDAVLAWPMFAPPGVPAERVAELRTAFESMLKDPQFLADAEKVGLDVELVPGPALQKLVDDLYGTPAEVIEIVKRAM
jgi:tripartite-type tricarboxylate transporter receptor subunit TctC